MAAQIQILDRSNYTKQHLVTLPPTTYPSLGPSSLRLQSKILGLTTNNFSYARLGHIMGWFDIHPIPPNTPAPYNDVSKYARISAWGYAEVIASTVPSIPVGHSVYGYLPIGTLPVDVNIELWGTRGSQFVVMDPHRQHLWKIYNRYEILPPLRELIQQKTLDSLGLDAVAQGQFATSYNLNRYGFAWDEKNLISPNGADDGNWTMQDADLKGATVVVLSASGKTAMSLGHQLKQGRPADQKPNRVIAVTSSASKELAQKSGFYDDVQLYGSNETAAAQIKESKPSKIVLLDFGARGSARTDWNSTLGDLGIPFQFIRVGGEVKPLTPEEATQGFAKMGESLVVNASKLREKGIEVAGDAYFDRFYKKWDDFKKDGAIPGMKISWGQGMEAWKDGWDKLSNDEISASVGLVYRL